MPGRTSTLFAILFCSVATPAAAAPLQPVEPWGLDTGATQCTAARSFGAATAPVTLGIVPSVSGGTYALLISEPESGPAFAQEASGTVDFGRGAIKSASLYFGSVGVKMRIHQFRITAAQMEQARSASEVDFRGEKGARFEFALSDVAPVLDALRKCTTDLQRAWNVGATVVTEKPLGDARAAFTTDDLPKEALQKQQHALAQYQLLVDEKGAVAGCDVLVPSGSALIDSVGCQLVKARMKFKPATDAAGKSIRSVWTSPPVTWRASHETFDNGCRVMNGNGSSVDMCGQTPDQRIRTPAQTTNTAAPGGSPPP